MSAMHDSNHSNTATSSHNDNDEQANTTELPSKQKQAAVIVIGNEILSGRTQDLNLNYIAKELNKLGINLAEGAVIVDDIDIIVCKVTEFSQKYDYVFTTGGIGPTHDDLTSEAIAQATSTKLELNQVVKEVLEDFYVDKGGLNEARLKMAMFPEGAEIIPNKISSAPGYKINNIFALAGIPKILQAMFDALKPHLEAGPLTTNISVNIKVSESKLASRLGLLQFEYPDVSIGSYPYTHNDNPCTSVVMRSLNKSDARRAAQSIVHYCSKSNLIILDEQST
ncbi:MAG: molybdopterin-binding protein [Pseudomonadota bacterium]